MALAGRPLRRPLRAVRGLASSIVDADGRRVASLIDFVGPDSDEHEHAEEIAHRYNTYIDLVGAVGALTERLYAFRDSPPGEHSWGPADEEALNAGRQALAEVNKKTPPE